jgi:hypothetical protein
MYSSRFLASFLNLLASAEIDKLLSNLSSIKFTPLLKLCNSCQMSDGPNFSSNKSLLLSFWFLPEQCQVIKQNVTSICNILIQLFYRAGYFHRPLSLRSNNF